MTERKCCHIGCEKPAEYVITFNARPDGYTESCLEHIPDLLDDSEHILLDKIEQVQPK